MAERRGPSPGAPEHHGASLRGEGGKQQSGHEDGKDKQSVKDERTKALLEYRALCTSARFWIQSELLDLRVGGYFPSSDTSRNASVQPSSVVPGETTKDSFPGVAGDLPSLMKHYLTCPLLARLLSHDPVLSGKVATLDRVLWHRRSKHEPQTAGWMSHDAFCPEGCSVGVPQGAAAEAVGKAGAPVRNAGANGSSRTSTMDSMLGTEGGPEAPGGGPLGVTEGMSQHYTESAEDESRPVTAWVACRRCMEHFAYIVASLLVFLKPSELRDLATERQHAQCCGFVFCGRRNVTTPEKRRAALWRWTLDFAGSKAVSEDELVQFCCSRCCNRQQQLLRLLDEEPMYARPGIKEWITDALQRKASHRPHPHGLTEAEILEEKAPVSADQKPQEKPKPPEDASAVRKCRRRSPPPPGEKRGPPVALEMLLNEAPGSLEASGLVGRVLESHSGASTESSSAEFSKTGSGSLVEGRRVPVSFDADDSSADEAPMRNVQKEGGAAAAACTAEERDHPSSLVAALAGGRHRNEAGGMLMLDYSGGGKPSEASSALHGAGGAVTGEDSLPLKKASSGSTDASTASLSDRADRRPSASSSVPPLEKAGEAARTEAQLPEQRGEGKQGQAAGSTASQAEAPIKSRGSRVRFADDDVEEGDGDGEGDSAPASVFKHFFNIKDEDDGPSFYSRADRQGSIGTHAAGGPSRSGTGELRSILKPATEPLEPAPPASSSAEAQVGYMRLSDLVIAFDLLSSCCTDASARFLAAYHRRFCTCACEGAVPAAPSTSSQHSEGEDSPKPAKGKAETSSRRARRKDNEGDESDSVSCMDGESGDEIDPSELWRRRQQQLLKAVLRSLPPSAENFTPLITELCETFQPLQPLPTLRCSLCSCIAAVLLLLLLLLRARPLTCCCCCEGCRSWSNSHERHSRCNRRQSPSAACGKAEGSEAVNAAASFYFDDALTIAREEDVGLALIDFVRSTISQSAPIPSPQRPLTGGGDTSSPAEGAETPAHHHEEKAIHVLLESIFSRITRPIMQLSQAAHGSPAPS